MFQNDADINCWNVAVTSEQGVQYWDFDILAERYPRLGQLIKANFDLGIFSFDFKTILNVTLV